MYTKQEHLENTNLRQVPTPPTLFIGTMMNYLSKKFCIQIVIRFTTKTYSSVPCVYAGIYPLTSPKSIKKFLSYFATEQMNKQIDKCMQSIT